MAASDQILAIDIGAWSIKLGEFENASEGLTMKQFGYGEYSQLMTDDNRSDLIRDTLQKILNEKQLSTKKVHLSLSSQLAFTRFVKLPPIEENEDRVKQIVEFEARQHVPFEMNEVIWDYQLIGTGEELDVMFVVIKNEIVEQITSSVESLGLKVVLVDVASSACYNASRANRIGDDSCAMVLSIGSRCSNLIFADGTHFFSRNIPIAGYAVTQQISKEFGIGIEEAEELKQRHGFVALGGAYEEPESEVAATISKIVRNVMTRLHGEVNRSINIYRSQQKGNKPVKLYLAGGSSTMAFTETFFQEKLRLDVEYLNPFQGIRLGGVIDRAALAEKAHLFSEVIGIALRVSQCPVEILLVPDKLKEEASFSGKKPFLYFSAVIAILIPVVFWLGSKSQRSNYESQISSVKKDVIQKRAQLDRINKALEAKKAIQTKIEKLTKVKADKFRCVEIIEQIEKWAPAGLWVTNIEPITGDINQKATKNPEVQNFDEMEGAGVRGSRRSRILKTRQQVQNSGQVVKGSANQISGFIVKGYFVNSTEKTTIDDVLFNYLSSLTLRQEKKIFQEDSKLTRIVDFRDSETVSNLNSFEIQLALYEPIGKK